MLAKSSHTYIYVFVCSFMCVYICVCVYIKMSCIANDKHFSAMHFGCNKVAYQFKNNDNNNSNNILLL